MMKTESNSTSYFTDDDNNNYKNNKSNLHKFNLSLVTRNTGHLVIHLKGSNFLILLKRRLRHLLIVRI